MTYHDALMTQLQKLVEIVQVLRSKLKTVDQDSLMVRAKIFYYYYLEFYLYSPNLSLIAVPETLPTQTKT